MKKLLVTSFTATLLIITGCNQQGSEELRAGNHGSKGLAQEREKEMLVLKDEEEEKEQEEQEEQETEDEAVEEEEESENNDEVTEESVAAKKTEEENENSDSTEKQADEKEEKTEQKEPEEEKQEEVEAEPEPEPEPTYESIYHNRGAFAVDGSTGATVHNGSGNFTIEASLNNIQTLSTGPVMVQLKSASKVSGDVTEQSLAGVAGDYVEYIQLDAVVTNTSSDPITFHIDNTRFESGGQTFYAHEMFSGAGKGYGDLQPYTEHHITLIYMIDSMNLKDIYSIYGVTDAPVNQNTGAKVGDAVNFNFSFSGA
ncbi:hypothetical protein [Alkalicoccobacillus murimartini]|uniref:Outer membrane biosynthesis protein TonB n=1 Tax=Alkalicoccobacillus murimartini TaxID=171685 RepID=A0ABT9YBY7_9BACI|nr:hypothetical protein [Alkalicoccobacillus murimartini]MDQ0205360.1 outer membrane biosynthesis protein TonB [Alkalicoccobacillus murimartini]